VKDRRSVDICANFLHQDYC